jgi:3'-phosphoadenosine 5'-phosphosulfate (PAPS) 3'-phosphatase
MSAANDNIKKDLEKILPTAFDIVVNAGKILRSHYKKDIEVITKEDGSPVTIADKESSEYMETELTKAFSEFVVVSEENTVEPNGSDPFFIIDPLDATKEFINRWGGYKVKLALMLNGEPLIGIVNSPEHEISYFGALGGNAYKKVHDEDPKIIKTRQAANDNKLGILFDAIHSDRNRYNKLCNVFNTHGLNIPAEPETKPGGLPRNLLVAEGAYDMRVKTEKSLTDDGKPASGRIWDSAADKRILVNAGGDLIKISDGEPLEFDIPARSRCEAYVALGDIRLAKCIVPK